MHTSLVEDLALPCQPRVVALLMSELLADVPNLRRLNQLFGSDPALAVQLLAMANAPACQMVGAVRGIPQAITLLGPAQLRQLLRRAQKGMGVRTLPGMVLEDFWQHSLAAAKLARRLASAVHMDGSVAYAAGLLHAVGQLALHHPAADTVWLDAEMGIWDPRRPRLEERRWGHCATQTSAQMLEQWHVPAELVDAVRCMENPLAFDQFEPLAGILHLAAWRTRTVASGWSERSTALSFPAEVGVALGLDMDVVLQYDASEWSLSHF